MPSFLPFRQLDESPFYTMEKKTASLTSGVGKTGQPLVKE